MTTLFNFDMTTLKTELRGIAALISVDRRARKPLHRQIYDSFRDRIIRRELRAGELVPSSRSLARELRVSRLPVLNAYAQLLAEGYFPSRVCAGTFIAIVQQNFKPRRLKLVADRLSGPAADVAFAESYRAMLDAGEQPPVAFPYDERVFRPRVAGLIAVGGALTLSAGWGPLAPPLSGLALTAAALLLYTTTVLHPRASGAVKPLGAG